MPNYEECQSYVNHLVAEHRRLHHMLVTARKTLVGGTETCKEDWTKKLVRTLREVRGELQRHFSEEEEGGCLDEAVSFNPALSPELRRIEREHPRILTEIDRLIAQAQDSKDAPSDRLTLETEFDDLCRELHAHEAAENDLLRKGFGTDVNGDSSGYQPTAPK